MGYPSGYATGITLWDILWDMHTTGSPRGHHIEYPAFMLQDVLGNILMDMLQDLQWDILFNILLDMLQDF